MKILVAIDDSEFLGQAIACVANLFQPAQTAIKVLHVLPKLGLSGPSAVLRASSAVLDSMAVAANSFVDKSVEKLRSNGFEAHSTVKHGDIIESILDAASDWYADLILLGSGRSVIAQNLLGSVAYSVVRRSKCSVLVVRLSTNREDTA
jgi:nucleotide-binding universal stress UspA family protein